MQQKFFSLQDSAAAFLDASDYASLLVFPDGGTVWYNKAFAVISGLPESVRPQENILEKFFSKAESHHEMLDCIRLLQNDCVSERVFPMSLAGNLYSISTKPLNIQNCALRLYNITPSQQQETPSADTSYYKQIIDSQSTLIAIGKDLKIIDCNKTFLSFFNVTDLQEFDRMYPVAAAALVECNDCIASTTNEELHRTIYKNKQRGLKTQVALISPATGKLHIMHISANMIDATQLSVYSIEDVTELYIYGNKLHDMNKLLEKEVETKAQEIEAANIGKHTAEQLMLQQSKTALMGEMIGVIAHQWKQPLSALSNIIQDIEDVYNCGDMTENIMSGYVKSVMEQVRFMYETINGFAGFFKPSEKYTILNVIEMIQSTEHLLSRQLTANSITVQYDISADAEAITVYGDKNEFRQVIMNLLVNAKDAITECRKKTASRTEGIIKISVSGNNGYIKISVQDNGTGIPDEFIGKLFRKYVTSKGEKGTGIGLHLCKMLITNMKGTISAANAESGAVFTITLPVCYQL